MYCSAGHAGKYDAISLHCASSPSYLKRTEVVKANVGKWWPVFHLAGQPSFVRQLYLCAFYKSHSEREPFLQQSYHLLSSMFFVPEIARGFFPRVQFEHGSGAESERTRGDFWPKWQGVFFSQALLFF